MIDDSIDYMKSAGVNDIVLIGRGFGGFIALLHDNRMIKAKILISPKCIISLGSNLKEARSIELKNFRNHEALMISVKDIRHNIRPILVIQGTKDEIAKKEDAERIYESLSNAKIEYLSAGHSFESKEQDIAIKKIVSFLRKNN